MKTITKIITILVLTTTYVNAQDFFIKKSLDWKMLTQGAGHSYEGDSSYNPEIMIGFEFENSRIGTGFEDHDTINYSKWFLEYNYKLTKGRFNFYAGFEVGFIWRKYYYTLSHFNNAVVTDTQASMTTGINLETQIRITDNIYLSGNINAFTTEGGDSERHQFLRWDVMGGLVFKIPYNL